MCSYTQITTFVNSSYKQNQLIPDAIVYGKQMNCTHYKPQEIPCPISKVCFPPYKSPYKSPEY